MSRIIRIHQRPVTCLTLLLLLALLAMPLLAGCVTTPPPAPEPEPEPVVEAAPEPEPEPQAMVPDMLTIQIYYQAKGLHDEARQLVDDYVSSLETPDMLEFTVEGYTCTEGYAGYNKRLSMWRAEDVKRRMVMMGIDPDVITVTGHGVENPVATNANRMGRVQNRRVTITASER